VMVRPTDVERLDAAEQSRQAAAAADDTNRASLPTGRCPDDVHDAVACQPAGTCQRGRVGTRPDQHRHAPGRNALPSPARTHRERTVEHRRPVRPSRNANPTRSVEGRSPHPGACDPARRAGNRSGRGRCWPIANRAAGTGNTRRNRMRRPLLLPVEWSCSPGTQASGHRGRRRPGESSRGSSLAE